MTVEEALKTHLQSHSAIAALVGTRITPLPVPEGTDKPAITYQVVGDELQTDLDGLDGEMNKVRVQIDCWSKNHEQVKALAELVRIRMQASGTSIKRSVPLNALEDYENRTKLHRMSRDYSCWYRIT